MSQTKLISILLVIGISFSSCIITDSLRTFNVEILKPALFVYPENADTIAILRRDIFESDTLLLHYSNDFRIRQLVKKDISYSNLANFCVVALEGQLKKDGYFKQIDNYKDSLNFKIKGDQEIIYPKDLFQLIPADVCIFLDYFHLENTYMNNNKDFLNTKATLVWSILFREDSLSYIYNHVDELTFDETNNPKFRIINPKEDQLLFDASHYLGDFFGSKLVPSWLLVERQYYRSGNPNMRQAEKLALANNWLKAAEIWNGESENKNDKITAKASYNMALACEMEGKIEAAIDWLVKSYSTLETNNKEHQANCQKYVNVLVMRKKEIEKLEKQVRNPESQ